MINDSMAKVLYCVAEIALLTNRPEKEVYDKYGESIMSFIEDNNSLSYKEIAVRAIKENKN